MLHLERLRFQFDSVTGTPEDVARTSNEYAFKLLINACHSLLLCAAWLIGLNSNCLSPHGVIYYETLTNMTSGALVNSFDGPDVDVQAISDICSYALTPCKHFTVRTASCTWWWL